MSNSSGTPATSSSSRGFLPGLVVGLVLGLLIGAFVPPLLENRPTSKDVSPDPNAPNIHSERDEPLPEVQQPEGQTPPDENPPESKPDDEKKPTEPPADPNAPK